MLAASQCGSEPAGANGRLSYVAGGMEDEDVSEGSYLLPDTSHTPGPTSQMPDDPPRQGTLAPATEGGIAMGGGDHQQGSHDNISVPTAGVVAGRRLILPPISHRYLSCTHGASWRSSKFL